MKAATEIEVADAMKSLQSVGFCIPRDVIRRLAFERGSLKRKLRLCKEAYIADHSVDVTDMTAVPLATLKLSELSGLSDEEIKTRVDEFTLPSQLEAWKTAATQLAKALVLNAEEIVCSKHASVSDAVTLARKIIAAKGGE